MLESVRRSEGTERETTEREPTETSIVDSPLFRFGRAVFGGVLAFMAIDNLRNLDERIGYAEAKGAPFPDVAVPAASTGLLFGSLGVILWRVPATAAAMIAWFFANVTPIMHDFWAQDDPEMQQQEFFHFMKNTAIFGAAVALVRVARRS